MNQKPFNVLERMDQMTTSGVAHSFLLRTVCGFLFLLLCPAVFTTPKYSEARHTAPHLRIYSFADLTNKGSTFTPVI